MRAAMLHCPGKKDKSAGVLAAVAAADKTAATHDKMMGHAATFNATQQVT